MNIIQTSSLPRSELTDVIAQIQNQVARSAIRHPLFEVCFRHVTHQSDEFEIVRTDSKIDLACFYSIEEIEELSESLAQMKALVTGEAAHGTSYDKQPQELKALQDAIANFGAFARN